MKTTAITLIWMYCLFGANSRSLASEARPDLTGMVVNPTGAPVPRATIFIYTAAPKQGTSSLCPSCYPDCRKKAETDVEGRFKIESLDPAMTFRLLVVAGGHESRFVSKVDPAKGARKIAMKPLSAADLNSKLRIAGMVVDENGRPLPGAVITSEGVQTSQMTRWGGNDSVVEPLAVTDNGGHFILLCKTNAVNAVYATLESPGEAEQWITLKSGGDFLLQMVEGVTLKGQITRDGQPLPGVSVAATTTDRTCGSYFNCDAVSTDSSGHFTLMNMPAKRQFLLYTTMNSMAGKGALPREVFTTEMSGHTQDLGRLSVQSAYQISGRVVLSDGKPVPANTRISLSRENAADTMETTIGAGGRFEFKGVPAESISLWVRVEGYQISKRNPSLDWLNGRILGRVERNVRDLVVLLDPGEWKFNNGDERPAEDDAYPANKPLRSATLQLTPK